MPKDAFREWFEKRAQERPIREINLREVWEASRQAYCKHSMATYVDSAINQAVEHWTCPDCGKQWSTD